MTKKIISVFLAFTLIFCSTAALAEINSNFDVLSLLSSLNIMKGDPDGNMRLEDPVTRAEFTKIIIASSNFRNSVASGTTVSPFKDVPHTHWAAPYIQLGVSNSYLAGYPDSTFRPENTVLFEEAITVMLKLLGYTTADFGDSWPYGQIGLANNIELTLGSSKGIGQQLTRGDVALLIYNALNTDLKNSANPLLSIFSHQMHEEVLMIATNNEDSNVLPGKVKTSLASYNAKGGDFSNYIGQKGDIITKNTSDLMFFVPYKQIINTYTITDIIGKDLVLNGEIFNFSDNMPVYYKSAQTAYSSIISTAKEGYTFKTFATDTGEIEYAFMFGSQSSGSTDVSNLEKYVIADKIGNFLIIYINGVRTELDVADSTVAYDDLTKTTFGSLKSKIEKNDTIYVKRDSLGNIEYISLKKENTQAPVTSELQKYIVYSKVDKILILYKDGNYTQLNIPDNTPAYQNNQTSTYTAVKDKLTLGDVIYVKYDEFNEVEYITVETGNLKGPFTVKSSAWQNMFDANLEQASYVRDGVKASFSSVMTNDVVYYSKDLNMIFAYSKKITGIYQNASPNKDMPTGIKVSGTEYTLEGMDAFLAVCSGGKFNYGDTVTLLFGKDGKIANVISPDESGEVIYGFLTGTGSNEYTNENGAKYSAFFASVVLPDGNKYEYICERDYKTSINKVVKVEFDSNYATLTQQNMNSDLYGKISSQTRTLGTSKLALNLQILDVSTTDTDKTLAYSPVYLQRLNNMELSSSKVLFTGKNSNNEIDKLILLDATGDMYKYGIMTKAESKSGNMSSSGSYTYIINGITSTSNTNFSLSISSGQPARFLFKGTALDGAGLLNSVQKEVVNITTTNVETDNAKYLLSDSVYVYKYSYSSGYRLIPLADVTGKDGYSKYIFNAFYDRSESEGGRIRVIIAYDKA